MANQVIPFAFESHEVRTLLIDDQPWFVASDVCAALAIVNKARAVSRLDDDEKGVHSMNTPGGTQNVGTINESGLYSLVLTSRKAEAKRFKKWVTAEVLPSIRKHGYYGRPADESLQEQSDPLSEQQAYHLRQLVSVVAMRSPESERASRFAVIYNQLKRAFGVTSYKDIPADRYQEAVALLDEIAGGPVALLSPDQEQAREQPAAIECRHLELPAPAIGPVEVCPVSLLTPDGSELGHLLRELDQAAKAGEPVLINRVEVPRLQWRAMVHLLQRQEQQLALVRGALSSDVRIVMNADLI